MKRLLTLLLVIMFALTLTACNGKKTKNELFEYDIITKLPEDTIVEITFWHSFGTTLEELISEYIDEFEKEYPNIKVNFVKEANNYTELRKKVVNNIVSASTPTLVMTYPDHVAAYLEGNAVLALDPFINNSEVGLSKEELDDFVDAYLEENKQTGHYMGLPFNKSTEVFIYNKTYFEENYEKPGFENLKTLYTKIKAGEIFTWDDVEKAAQDIKEAEKDRDDAANIYPFAYDSNANLFITWIRQHGLQYTNTKGEILFNNNDVANALGKWREYHNKGLFALPAQWEADYASQAFIAKQAYMTVGSSAGVRHNIPKDKDGKPTFELGIAPIPQYDLNKKAVIQQGTNISLMANSTDEQRLAAWLLIKYLTSVDVTTHWAIHSGYLPVRKSAYETEEYKEFLANPDAHDDIEVVYNAHTAKAARLQVDYMFYDPAFPTSASVRDQADQAMQTIVYNKEKGVKQILQEAVDALEW